MLDFMKKAMDWALEKEAAAAKNCHATPEDIDRQIKAVEEKREKLKKQFEEDDAEFGHILDKLHFIKAASLKCQTDKKA
ncbi:MAG TPA: hypothetical protein ENK39_02115 [Epsilonproteobacteria bacterium]|nr:hypothetical protein [Campylobacterota bacterium]